MYTRMNSMKALLAVVFGMVVLLAAAPSHAKIDGIKDVVSGPGVANFALTAKPGYILTGDGNSIYVWGYAHNGGGDAQKARTSMQYPGPTIIVDEGDTVTVTLTNNLPQDSTSLLFPGFDVSVTGGTPGFLTGEAVPGASVTYTFVADKPGTFLYQSGTDMELQIEMGLVGALIVRPAGYVNADDDPDRRAYTHTSTRFNHEVLYLHTEMDHRIHEYVEEGKRELIDFSTWFPYYWFYNGRTALDTMSDSGVPWLPNQPYNTFPRMHVGDAMLIRIIGAGRDPHPFHHHGNSGWVIARDGQLLSTDAAAVGPDLAEGRFTEFVLPGETMDVIFDPWHGAELGWDIYGHQFWTDAAVKDRTTVIKNPEVYAESTVANWGGTQVTLANGADFPLNRPFRAVIHSGAEYKYTLDQQGNITGITTVGVDTAVDDFGIDLTGGGNLGVVYLKRTTPGSDVFNVVNDIEPVNQDGGLGFTPAGGDAIIATYHGRMFDLPGGLNSVFPVLLPDQKDLTLGAFYGGSPFLGVMGSLPPGEGGYNIHNGLAFMWHSHNEKEMTNNDIFPGGQMTMLIIEPEEVDVPISEF